MDLVDLLSESFLDITEQIVIMVAQSVGISGSAQARKEY